jgi:hypothetical protein
MSGSEAQAAPIPNGLWGIRVLIADSVYEDAQVTVRNGVLYIEFDAEDLESISVDLKQLSR